MMKIVPASEALHHLRAKMAQNVAANAFGKNDCVNDNI